LFDLPNAQGLELETLFIEDLYLVSPPGHESSCHQEVPFSELGTLPLILPTRVQGLRMAVERAAFASRTALVVRAEVDAVSNIIAAVRAGLGHSVLSRVSVIHDPIQPGLPARRIIAPEIRRSAQLATGTNQMQSGAVRVVKEVVRRLIQTRIASGAWHVSSIKAASDL
jgi:LysR family nitrogen assimilation transcriptional regulator